MYVFKKVNSVNVKYYTNLVNLIMFKSGVFKYRLRQGRWDKRETNWLVVSFNWRKILFPILIFQFTGKA